jgi:hypothetical protein
LIERDSLGVLVVARMNSCPPITNGQQATDVAVGAVSTPEYLDHDHRVGVEGL